MHAIWHSVLRTTIKYRLLFACGRSKINIHILGDKERAFVMFGLFKKKADKQPEDVRVNSLGKTMDKLEDGDLPWGWVTHYKDFTDKINEEYRYFLQCWWDAKGKEPKQEYAALKSLLQYMDDVQRLCDQKGECFAFWCSEYLIGKQKQKCEERLAKLETK